MLLRCSHMPSTATSCPPVLGSLSLTTTYCIKSIKILDLKDECKILQKC